MPLWQMLDQASFYMLQTYVTDVYFLQTRVQQIIPVVNTFVYQVYTFHQTDTFHQTENLLWHSWACCLGLCDLRWLWHVTTTGTNALLQWHSKVHRPGWPWLTIKITVTSHWLVYTTGASMSLRHSINLSPTHVQQPAEAILLCLAACYNENDLQFPTKHSEQCKPNVLVTVRLKHVRSCCPGVTVLFKVLQ